MVHATPSKRPPPLRWFVSVAFLNLKQPPPPDEDRNVCMLVGRISICPSPGDADQAPGGRGAGPEVRQRGEDPRGAPGHRDHHTGTDEGTPGIHRRALEALPIQEGAPPLAVRFSPCGGCYLMRVSGFPDHVHLKTRIPEWKKEWKGLGK